MNRFLVFFLVSFIVHLAMGALLLSRSNFFGGKGEEGSGDMNEVGTLPSTEDEPALTDPAANSLIEGEKSAQSTDLINVREESPTPPSVEKKQEEKTIVPLPPEPKPTPPKKAQKKKAQPKKSPAKLPTKSSVKQAVPKVPPLKKPKPKAERPSGATETPTTKAIAPLTDKKPKPKVETPKGTAKTPPPKADTLREEAPNSKTDSPLPLSPEEQKDESELIYEEEGDEEDRVLISKKPKVLAEEWVDEDELLASDKKARKIWMDEGEILKTKDSHIQTVDFTEKPQGLMDLADFQTTQPPPSPGNTIGSRNIPALDMGKARQHSQLKQLKGNPLPIYPEEALKKKWEGRAEIVYYVNPAGFVEKIQLKSSSGHRALDNSALRALARYRYHPGQEGWVKHPVEFFLEMGKEIKKTATLGEKVTQK